MPIPAPQKGINAVDGLISMDAQESIYQYNLIPSQYGVRVRTGYKQHATNVGTVGIRTLVPFTGSTSSADRLFAMTQDGIYNVSTSGSSYSAANTFGTTGATSGYGIWTSYTTTAGHFSLYCDELNGYYVYTESAGTWAKIVMGGGGTEISGTDPVNFVSATIFKSRVWFIKKNSAKAYYLAAGSIFGAATEFNFGNKFKHGGTLVQLINWTVDGGEGIDDYLIAISSAGDVVVYKGNDPASATDFIQHGSWFIGSPPAGRRIAGSFGGEVYILSTYGLLPMSKLISGTLIQQNDIYLTKKITPLINEQMILSQAVLGWEVKLIPSEQLMLISIPDRTGFDPIQFVQSLNTEGWAIYQNMPYYTGEVWNSVFYFSSGTTVYTHEGDKDNVNLAETSSDNIEWSALQTFNDFGEPGIYHRAQFVRPVFLAQQPPAYAVDVRYDYNIDTALPTPNPGVFSSGAWDVGLWDFALWSGDFTPVSSLGGADGMGRAMAVGCRGNSGTRTILVRYDLMFDSGGMI